MFMPVHIPQEGLIWTFAHPYYTIGTPKLGSVPIRMMNPVAYNAVGRMAGALAPSPFGKFRCNFTPKFYRVPRFIERCYERKSLNKM
jgi:hypothetical protein